MKNLQKLKLVTLSTALCIAASANTALAGSKIWTNGSWIEAKSSTIANLWNNNAILNSKVPNLVQQLAQNFIEQNNQVLGLRENITLNASSINSGEEFNTIRYKKKLLGLDVLGGETLVHVANNEVELVNADTTDLNAINVIPHLSSKDAESLAFAAYRGQALSVDENTQLKVLITKNDAEENVANLVYEVTVRDRDELSSDIHFIDAHTGEELLASTNIHTLKDRRVLAGAGGESDFELDESSYKLVYADAGCSSVKTASTGNVWKDYILSARAAKNNADKSCSKVNPAVAKSANTAFKNAGTVYDYFKSAHSRDSIDGRGMTLKSVVNFGDAFNNAAWVNDKGLMIYGMGDGKQFGDFAAALDVAGHELTHGVTSRTANLQYVSESGALNESYSDVFGKIIDIKYGKGSSDWKIGKELFKGGNGAIRDMENPEVGHTKDFKYRGEKCSRDNDFCGVHSNSGIANRAAVMIIKSIGAEKTAKMYYLTLTQLLRSGSNFKEAKAQTLAACKKLYKNGSECQEVTKAFDAVGI